MYEKERENEIGDKLQGLNGEVCLPVYMSHASCSFVCVQCMCVCVCGRGGGRFTLTGYEGRGRVRGRKWKLRMEHTTP